MGGIGHGNHESTSRQREQEQERFTNRNFSNTESPQTDFEGSMSISNIPEKLEFVNNSKEEPKKQGSSNPVVYQNAEELEIQYEMLSPAELNGLGLIDTLVNGGDGNEFLPELVSVMEKQGLLDIEGPEIEPTSTGVQAYNNWSGFRDNYLTGESHHDRMDTLESELGVEAMPWFLERNSDLELDLDQYLSRKQHSRSSYDPNSEFESVMGTLHGYEERNLGDHVRSLEILKNPEEYNEEVPQEIRQEFKDATALGIIDDDDVLTQDGKVLYTKVQADACYLNW